MITKGFTLIELIIVIGIIALLATTVILVINPANLFREARDSQRIADLGQLNSAMGLYLASVTSLDLSVGAADCLVDWRASTSALVAARQPFLLTGNTGAEEPEASQTLTNPRAIDGTGWIGANFTLVSGGAPVSNLPVDPNADTTANLDAAGRYYAYACDGSPNFWYEFNASMESARFDGGGGGDDVESTDGGTRACSGAGNQATRCDVTGTPTKANLIYEVGNDPNLDL